MSTKKRKSRIRTTPWEEVQRREMVFISIGRRWNGVVVAYLHDEVTEACSITAPGCVSVLNVRSRLVRREPVDIRDDALFAATGGTLVAMVKMVGEAVDGIVDLTLLRERLTEKSNLKGKEESTVTARRGFCTVKRAVALFVLLSVSGCREPPCSDEVKVLSWLHVDGVSCSHKNHVMSLERVGLKAVMRCTCTR